MKRPPSTAVRGSTLIEVLVAILIASIGLLAMARLSAAAISHQKSAQMRLTGLSLAQQYADRARLNVYGYDLGLYTLALGDTAPTRPRLDVDADELTAAQNLAQDDRSVFLSIVRTALPEGRVRVDSLPTATSRDLDIWLLWRDTALDDADTLGAANQQCPDDLNANARNGARCMHFRVNL